MSLHKSDLATLPYLPSVISRWQAAPHTISPTNHNMVGQFQADILALAADDEDAFHILSCLPTGYGKSLPMLMLSLFLPQGTTIEYTGQGQPAFNAGSITVVVVPLTSIGDQLKMECSRLGLSAVVGGQVVWSPIGVVSNINLQLRWDWRT